LDGTKKQLLCPWFRYFNFGDSFRVKNNHPIYTCSKELKKANGNKKSPVQGILNENVFISMQALF
jgi:hypothetical protein